MPRQSWVASRVDDLAEGIIRCVLRIGIDVSTAAAVPASSPMGLRKAAGK